MTNDPQPEGILILGAPRSGTTLLRRLVDAHPNIACPGETNVFTAAGRFLGSERIAGGTGIGVLDGLSFAGFDESEVLRRLRELAFSFHRDHARAQEKGRWASKTAFDSFYLTEIEKLCAGHVRFICIQRHGFDVACSLQELCERNGGYLRELHAYVVRHPIVVEACAHAWVDLSTALHELAERRAAETLELRYEDLIAEPDAAMARVMQHVGEEWDPSYTKGALAKRSDIGLGDWKTYGTKKVHGKSIGRWRQLPADTKRRLAEICNPTLALLGYAQVAGDTDESGGDEEARRRYQLGLMMQGIDKDTGKGDKRAARRGKKK